MILKVNKTPCFGDRSCPETLCFIYVHCHLAQDDGRSVENMVSLLRNGVQ